MNELGEIPEYPGRRIWIGYSCIKCLDWWSVSYRPHEFGSHEAAVKHYSELGCPNCRYEEDYV